MTTSVTATTRVAMATAAGTINMSSPPMAMRLPGVGSVTPAL
jgi:hypothetical protein